ncbi:hypothetical protein Axi01nite_97020 [Actinoplanes xinjiangensis]|nr:hypothetical protein Axi01nite_97020 [Actinoplanes xinjiangensis]
MRTTPAETVVSISPVGNANDSEVSDIWSAIRTGLPNSRAATRASPALSRSMMPEALGGSAAADGTANTRAVTDITDRNDSDRRNCGKTIKRRWSARSRADD